jgi:hypothetical protein
LESSVVSSIQPIDPDSTLKTHSERLLFSSGT